MKEARLQSAAAAKCGHAWASASGLATRASLAISPGERTRWRTIGPGMPRNGAAERVRPWASAPR
jgi:hypothetical protein